MNQKFYTELTRVLNGENIKSNLVGDGNLEILYGDNIACHISNTGKIYYMNGDLPTSETSILTDKIHPIAYQVHEYTGLVETAPNIKSDSGNDDFKLLAEFSDTILAGKILDSGGYMFVTWLKDGSGNGYTHGHYFQDNYRGAKEDFAKRAGLVLRDKLFSEEEMAVMHKCMTAAVFEGTVLSYGDEKIAEELCEQIEYLYPNINAQPEATPQQNMEQTM